VHAQNPLDLEAAANLTAAKVDLATAYADGDAGRALLLETLVSCGGHLLVYRPQLQHYSVIFGDIGGVRHVALIVPGVGDGTNMCSDWIPGAMNLYDAADATAAVILWKGYDNPANLLAAAEGSIECTEDLVAAGEDLAAFVGGLALGPHQSLTVVAHSFGSIVTGCALADHDLQCTDVVVAGSPGMTVDDLRQLHLEESHFFSEQAPGDAIAELGIFGAAPSAPTFGGTRMRTNAPGHVPVQAHSSYFVAGSEALENIVAVVTGRYSKIVRHRTSVPERAGGLVAWALRAPAVPVRVAGRHYRGPGWRVMANACRLIDFGATQTGNAVCDTLDEAERALFWAVRRVGGNRVSFGRSLPDG
jgi:pimeloyl-ACP methyl ester carboxylesterase